MIAAVVQAGYATYHEVAHQMSTSDLLDAYEIVIVNNENERRHQESLDRKLKTSK